MLRSALRTLLLYRPKFGSSPEARKAINPRPVTPGPCWPPVQSPFSVCVLTRYCKPLSYSSRTSRGTPSPIRAFSGCAPAPDTPPNKTSARASIRDMNGLLSARPSGSSLGYVLGYHRQPLEPIGLTVLVRPQALLSEERL